MTATATRSRWIPAPLILLSLVPVVAGALRVTQLATGAQVMQEKARISEAPVPVLLHIFGAIVFALVGAFQFAPMLRRRRPRWHRLAGRVVVLSGLTVALSGIWMTLFYDLPDTEVLLAFRLLAGTGMALCLILGFLAVRRRDFARHRAWMIRGYAIGLGAGTQAFTLTAAMLLPGMPEQVGSAVGHAAGWLINLAVAEWIIRRPAVRSVARRSPV